MQLNRVSALATLPLLFLFGCSGSVSATESTQGNLSTGQTNVTFSVTGTLNLGGAKPNISQSGGSGTSSQPELTQEVPGSFQVDPSVTPQVTLTAQTDTGYTSSITLALQPTSTTQSPSKGGDTMYAWYLPDSADLDAWEQNVESNSNNEVSVSSSAKTGYLSGGSGNYSIESTVQLPGFSSTVSASSSFVVTGNPSRGKCPNAPGCPVQPDPTPDGE